MQVFLFHSCISAASPASRQAGGRAHACMHVTEPVQLQDRGQRPVHRPSRVDNQAALSKLVLGAIFRLTPCFNALIPNTLASSVVVQVPAVHTCAFGAAGGLEVWDPGCGIDAATVAIMK